MIILDTNVISQLSNSTHPPVFASWLDNQHIPTLYTTAITESELLFGLELLPSGSRKTTLSAVIEKALSKYFANRILPFDSDAALICAQIRCRRRLAGRPISYADAQIAAIALSQSATLATRNTKDFQDIGLTLINPWELPG